jgi:hypothetical protein
MPSDFPQSGDVIVISSDDEPRPLVIPRVVFNSKGTRALRRLIRRQQREAEFRAQRRAKAERVEMKKKMKSGSRTGRKEEKRLAALQNRLNRNQSRAARPKKGMLKDRDNSDPSEDEEDDCFVLFNKPAAGGGDKAATTTTTTTTTITTTTTVVTSANRPVRTCRARVCGRSLADVEHSAGSDDEDRVLPNFQSMAAPALPTDKEVVQLLLRLGGAGV